MSKPFKPSGDLLFSMAIKLHCELPGEYTTVDEALREVVHLGEIVQKELDLQVQEATSITNADITPVGLG